MAGHFAFYKGELTLTQFKAMDLLNWHNHGFFQVCIYSLIWTSIHNIFHCFGFVLKFLIFLNPYCKLFV